MSAAQRGGRARARSGRGFKWREPSASRMGGNRLSRRRYSCAEAAPWDKTTSAEGGTNPLAGEHQKRSILERRTKRGVSLAVNRRSCWLRTSKCREEKPAAPITAATASKPITMIRRVVGAKVVRPAFRFGVTSVLVGTELHR